MKLVEVLKDIQEVDVSGNRDIDIHGIEHDSRRVLPGQLFVAIQGFRFNGAEFIDEAVKAGAVAVATEADPPHDMPVGTWIKAADSRSFMSLAAANFYGPGEERIRLVGITGTNGKSTVAFLIQAIWQSAGLNSGMLGTIFYQIGDRCERAERTTPESIDIHRFLVDLHAQGCDHCVMEVSSHALAMKRVLGLSFQAAVFTNLTQDHMDFHPSMDAYFSAKKELFTYLSPDGTAVINADDPRSEALKGAVKGKAVTFGINRDADYRPASCSFSRDGIQANIKTPGGDLKIRSSLLGRPNLYNILAAVATACETGISLPVIARGLRELEGVPGRFERISEGQDFLAIVDFAHTDNALENLLLTIREITDGRLITVLGCGGDRDKGKRPLMGAVAAGMSDIAIVTSDNPRSEDPLTIINDIMAGTGKTPEGGGNCLVIPERREAIRKAVSLAAAGDAVVLAGKGHETGQTFRDGTKPFDDREELRKALKEIWHC